MEAALRIAQEASELAVAASYSVDCTLAVAAAEPGMEEEHFGGWACTCSCCCIQEGLELELEMRGCRHPSGVLGQDQAHMEIVLKRELVLELELELVLELVPAVQTVLELEQLVRAVCSRPQPVAVAVYQEPVND